MKIVALIDVHPLDGSNQRGLSMRIAGGGQMFDLPISKEQAALILSKMSPAEPPAPTPPSAEEMSLFAQFASDTGLEGDESYYDEDDDL